MAVPDPAPRLLTAVARYQVDGAVVEDNRLSRSGSAALVEMTSWASFAAREVGGWTPVRQDRTPGEDTGWRPPHAGVEHGRSGRWTGWRTPVLPTEGRKRE